MENQNQDNSGPVEAQIELEKSLQEAIESEKIEIKIIAFREAQISLCGF